MKNKLIKILLLPIALFIFASCTLILEEEKETGFDIQNDSYGNSIYNVFISPANNTTWGNDLLGTSTLAPGESELYEFESGYYDIKIRSYYRTYTKFDIYLDDEEVIDIVYDGSNVVMYNIHGSSTVKEQIILNSSISTKVIQKNK